MPAGGSCLLGSINLSEFVTKNKIFDFDDFAKTVDIAIGALNEVLIEGLPLHPLQEQRESVHDWRQIGLGIFGLADMLIKMEIKYGSKEAIEICDMIGYKMAYQALESSSKLAEKIGCYPKYNKEAIGGSLFWSKHTSELNRKKILKSGLANSQLLTIAPTGSLSSMFGVSGGIEPIYANYYERKTESLHGHDEFYKVYTPIVKDYMDQHGITDDKSLPDYFVTAQTLDYKERINMQAVWQQHIDASISSTVNVPNDFTVEQVEDLYMLAWEKGLKGVTIYRDGCKRSGILSSTDTSIKESKKECNEPKFPRGMIIKADNNCIGKKRTLHTGCGTLHCVALFDPVTGDLLETYLSKGSAGGCLNTLTGLSRLMSLSARGGVDIYSIVDQLKSCGTCPSYAVRRATKHDTSAGSSCPVAVGNALLDMYKEMQNDIGADDETVETENSSIKEETSVHNKLVPEDSKIPQAKCPECGGILVFEGGCQSCKICGYTKCE